MFGGSFVTACTVSHISQSSDNEDIEKSNF